MIPKIMLVALSERQSVAAKVQKVLTKHGCYIKTRIGFHEAEQMCSPCGLIILNLVNKPAEIKKLHTELNAVKGVEAKLVQMKCPV